MSSVDLPAAAPAIQTTSAEPADRIPLRVWDAPLRLFHASLAVSVTLAVVTGKAGGEWMVWHGRVALLILGLLVFRLVWGFVGPTTARFQSFVPTPSRLLAYVRGQWQGVGHNPLGALSVFAILALLAWQVGSGLFSNDDLGFAGPLAGRVTDALSNRLTGLHQRGGNLVIWWMALHAAAIAFYTLVKKHSLLRPMLTGWRVVERAQVPPQRGGGVLALLGSVLIAVALVLVLLFVDWIAPMSSSTPSVPASTESGTPAW